jgi:hypothetical protein
MVRGGIITRRLLDILRRCCRPLPDNHEVKATTLYPTRLLADEDNCREFALLQSPIYRYAAVDSREEDILRDLHAAEQISLRVGAQVMLLANLNVREGLVNGTRGIVTGFASKEEIQSYLQHHGDSDCVVRNWEPTCPFPKVLFETRDTTREVGIPSILSDMRLLFPLTRGLFNWVMGILLQGHKYL